jgi:hypothetical protein
MTVLNAAAYPFRALKAYRLPYPVKRDFDATPTWWFTAVASCGIVMTMLLTAAASAYEPISVYSRTFNTSNPLWYENVLGTATSTLGLSKSRVCSGSIIQLGDGDVLCWYCVDVDIVTTSGFMEYQLIYYIDNRTSLEKANDGLLYADEILQDCSVLMLNLLTFDPAVTSSNQGQVAYPQAVDGRGWSLVIHQPVRSSLQRLKIRHGILLGYLALNHSLHRIVPQI